MVSSRVRNSTDKISEKNIQTNFARILEVRVPGLTWLVLVLHYVFSNSLYKACYFTMFIIYGAQGGQSYVLY